MLAPANQPGHQDRRGTGPAAGHALPGNGELPGGDRGRRPQWHRVRVRIPKPKRGDGAYRPGRLPQLPGRHPASTVKAPGAPGGGHMRRLALTPSAGAAVAAMARLPRSSRARKENAMSRLRVIVVESRDGLVREQLPGRRGTGRKGGVMRRLSFIGVCLTPVLLLLGTTGTPAAASTSVPVTIQDTVIIGPFTGTWSASGG